MDLGFLPESYFFRGCDSATQLQISKSSLPAYVANEPVTEQQRSAFRPDKLDGEVDFSLSSGDTAERRSKERFGLSNTLANLTQQARIFLSTNGRMLLSLRKYTFSQ